MDRSVTDSPGQTSGQRGEPLGEVIANVAQVWTVRKRLLYLFLRDENNRRAFA
jgi:hypothetical protein